MNKGLKSLDNLINCIRDSSKRPILVCDFLLKNNYIFNHLG